MIDARAAAGAGPAHGATPLVLVDTSAWVWHARFGDPLLDQLIAQAMVVGHVDVAGEIAMGHPPGSTRFRDRVLALPPCAVVAPDDRLIFVEEHGIAGAGIGWVDAGLVASCMLDGRPIAIYTRDNRLSMVARRVGIVVMQPPGRGPGSVN